MIGTFVKDLKNLSGQLFYYAILIVVFFGVGAVSGNIYFYAGLSIFCGVVAPLSAVSYDEKDNWDKFALASGVTRSELAVSRYLLGLSVLLPVWALSFLFFALPSFRTAENLLAVFTFGGLGLIVFDCVLPLIYRIGVEKSRVVYMIIVMAVMALSVGAASLVELAGGDPARVVAGIILALGILGVPVSAAVSCRIYRRKDF